ncbi:hypothetical protein PG991_001686, partial [Apiospora marii]
PKDHRHDITREYRLMICNICGCPIFPPPPQASEGGVEEGEHPKWLGQAVMLSDPAEEFETLELHYRAGKKPGVPELEFTRDDQEIQRDEVTMATPYECLLVKDGTRVRPNWGVGHDDGGGRHPSSTPYGILVHAACLDIVERAMRNKSRRRNPHVHSLRALWKVLRMRRDACDNELMGTDYGPAQHEPLWRRNFHYLYNRNPLSSFVRTSRRGFDGEWVFFFFLFQITAGFPECICAELTVVCMQSLEDPTTTPDLTDMLLSDVRRVESEAVHQEAQSFRQAFMSLPLELRENILEFLSACDDLHSFCTRLLPQEVWRDMLLGKKFLPFLYDIDDAAVLRCVQETEGKAGNKQVDWESLVRSLSRGAWASRDCRGPPPPYDGDEDGGGWDPRTGYYYCDLPAPTGLRNRRRIWQLAEEMFVGDVLPSKSSGASVPRYWDEYGERVYPVVRLSE